MHYVDRLRGDIGVFGEHSKSLGREFLIKTPNFSDQKKVDELIRSLKGSQNADFQVIQGDVSQLSLKKLREFADKKYNAALDGGIPSIQIEDLKIELSQKELTELLGNDTFNYLQ